MAMALFRMYRSVRFQDVDAAGIVFFTRVFDYFHDALMDHYAAHGVDMPNVVRDAPWITPIVHAEADYKAPMRFGDEVVVEIDRADVGKSSVTVHYVIRSASGAPRVHCVGRTVFVCIGRETFTPRGLPTEIREAFRAPQRAPEVPAPLP